MGRFSTFPMFDLDDGRNDACDADVVDPSLEACDDAGADAGDGPVDAFDACDAASCAAVGSRFLYLLLMWFPMISNPYL